MQVLSQKVSSSTKLLTASNDIWVLIRLVFLDDQGLIEMFQANIDYFKSKPVNIPKITVMVEHGYNPEYLIKELEKIYSQIMTKIRFKVAPKMSKQEKKSQEISGFVVEIYRHDGKYFRILLDKGMSFLKKKTFSVYEVTSSTYIVI